MSSSLVPAWTLSWLAVPTIFPVTLRTEKQIVEFIIWILIVLKDLTSSSWRQITQQLKPLWSHGVWILKYGREVLDSKLEIQVSTCVSDKKDVAWSICRQLFQQKPEARAASSLCIHTAATREMTSNCDEANNSERNTCPNTLVQYKFLPQCDKK